MTDTDLAMRLSDLCTSHKVLKATIEERMENTIRAVNQNTTDLEKLKTAYWKMSVLVAILASGSGGLGAAVVNYLMNGAK